MLPIASTTAILVTVYLNIGIVIGLAIASILVAWSALAGLYFAMKKTQKYVTGSGGFLPTKSESQRTANWDELDRRARGSLEHDAM